MPNQLVVIISAACNRMSVQCWCSCDRDNLSRRRLAAMISGVLPRLN